MMPESAGIRLECPEFLRLFVSLSRFYFVRVVFMYSPHYVIFTYFANFTDFACENGHDGPRDHVLLGIATPYPPRPKAKNNSTPSRCLVPTRQNQNSKINRSCK